MTVQRQHTVIPGEPLIKIEHVSRRFEKKLDRSRSFQDLFIRLFRRQNTPSDEFWPLQDISLTINAGDCVGIIGPNGTGKSTLLKLIAGILQPTSGDLTVRGRISSLLELGAGFQPDLTGRENIYLNGSIYGLSRKQINQRLDSIIDYAEIGDFIDTPVKHYSSGMHVRLGFAIAIHTDPDLLLVDEVLAVGDGTFQHKCLSSIYQFRRNGGTLLLVSHDLNTIQSICTHAIWIEEGAIAAQGNPTNVIMAYTKNMAQIEEKRLAKTEIVPSKTQRWGTGQAQIVTLEICNGLGKPQLTFVTGDDMEIRLHYRSDSRIEYPVFGLAIHHQNGTHVFGPNTRFGGITIPDIEGEGVVVYRIPSLALLEGEYVLSAAIVNETDTEIFDYHDRVYPFRVFSGPIRDGYGLVRLHGQWRHETDAQAVSIPENDRHNVSVNQWAKA